MKSSSGPDRHGPARNAFSSSQRAASRAIPSISRRISLMRSDPARSVLAAGRLVSRSGSTARSSMPAASSRSIPLLPTASRSTSSLTARSPRAVDATRAQPCDRHRPHTPERVHRDFAESARRARARYRQPSGFFQATRFSRGNLFGATPADAAKASRLTDRRLRRCATTLPAFHPGISPSRRGTPRRATAARPAGSPIGRSRRPCSTPRDTA